MRKNLPLIVGIALPLIFIVGLFLAVTIPSLFINPQHDFVYVIAAPEGYAPFFENQYIVTGGKIALQPVTLPATQYPSTVVQDMAVLYLYDVSTNSSHQISFSDAQKLTLDPGPTSPDGYTVGYAYGDSGVFDLFGGNTNDSGYYISKGGSSRRLSAISDSTYGNDDFRLIGWVE